MAAGMLLLQVSPSHGAAQSPTLVDLDGRHLEVVQEGNGQPVVVVEAGIGANWREWAPIFDSISPITKIVSYSRAGYGTSDSVAAPRTPLEITAELHALLRTIDAEPPYVLVGHSFGGLLMSVFASQYPDEVAGLLLVDSTHARQIRAFEALSSSFVEENERQLDNLVTNVGGAVTQEAVGLWPIMLRGTLPEADPLPAVPTVVLTSMQVDPRSPSVAFTEAGKQTWRRLHAELFEHATQGAHIVTTRSGHDIHRDEPALVVDSIRWLVQWAR